jgi:transposase
MLSIYKSQQVVEKGLRFLKSPDFLTSIFYVKKPERIEALLMVMTTCLMVYAALEHTIRKQLKAQDEYFLDTKKKPTQTPTARWVFQCFMRVLICLRLMSSKHCY